MTKKKQESAQTSTRRRATVQHRELAPGTVLTARVKGRELSASVVTGPEGKPEVEFEGARYPSLSAAAGYPVNGWRFWRAVEQPQE